MSVSHQQKKQSDASTDALAMSKADPGSGAKSDPRQRGVGQAVKAGVEINLRDTRNAGSALVGNGGNLGPEGVYAINPAISATLGENMDDIGDPTIVLGDQLLGSHVQVRVENSETTREDADGGHEQIRFNARYTLKNAKEWSTPQMSLHMKMANTQELQGSVNAEAPLKIGGVGVEGGAEVGGSNTSSNEFEAAIDEFQLGGTDSYFAHSHDIEMVISSSGYATATVRRSFGVGNHQPAGVTAERRTFAEKVSADGSKQSDNQDLETVQMPLLR